jgi:hypothetical protein
MELVLILTNTIKNVLSGRERKIFKGSVLNNREGMDIVGDKLDRVLEDKKELGSMLPAGLVQYEVSYSFHFSFFSLVFFSSSFSFFWRELMRMMRKIRKMKLRMRTRMRTRAISFSFFLCLSSSFAFVIVSGGREHGRS